MVSLQPVKPIIISFCAHNLNPQSIFASLCIKVMCEWRFVFLHLLGEHARVVYITYTMATRVLPDIYSLAQGLGHIYQANQKSIVGTKRNDCGCGDTILNQITTLRMNKVT